MSEVHLPTIGGQISALHIDSDTPKILSYRANITQVGVNPPVAAVTVNTLGGVPVYTYSGVGTYVATLAGAFVASRNLNVWLTPNVYDANASGGLKPRAAGAFITSDDTIGIFTENLLSTAAGVELDSPPLDGIMIGNVLVIDMYATDIPVDSETALDVILSKLDAIQANIWTKIVVRFNGTVTEVDGKKYRKTGVFATSSKLIQS